MTEQQFQLIRAAGFLADAGLAVAAQPLKRHAGHPGSWRQNLGLWAIDAVVVGALCGACACTAARWAAGSGLGALNVLGAPAWLGIPVSVAALDLVSYGWHRANHRVPPLWRFHRVHHSDPGFTVSTGVRFHPGELVLSLPLRLAAGGAVGASPAAVVVFEIAFTVANLIEHGDIDVVAPVE